MSRQNQEKHAEYCKKHTWCSEIPKPTRKTLKEMGLSFEEHELKSAVKQYADILEGLNGLYSLITNESITTLSALAEERQKVSASDLESAVSSDKFQSLVNCTESSLSVYLDIAKSQSLFERTVLHANIAREILTYLSERKFGDALNKLEEFYKAVKRNGYLAF